LRREVTTDEESCASTVGSGMAVELRGSMESSAAKDAGERAPESERAQLPGTLFGYSKSTEDSSAEGGEVDASTLE
jgi:hypothetical protein